jgi:hypothetical protein
MSLEQTDPTELRHGRENRIAKRISCDAIAEGIVPYCGLLFRGEISNLSLTGCFMKTRATLNMKRSTSVELRFTINGEQFSIPARFVRIHPGGAGFEFSLVEPGVHKNLQALMQDLEASSHKKFTKESL